MAFTRARIRNFQSLKSVDIELKPLTVVVGESSSGKSAFLRALRVLTCNSHTSHFVTHGEKHAVIEIEDDEGSVVTLERGKSLSTYRTKVGGKPEEYPKSNKEVPEEVRRAFKGLPVEIEGEMLNFASQFDKPFLLDESPSKVAKVLGDLTNITILHDAVREANRRRLEANSKLKVRRSDLEEAQTEIEQYRALPERRDHLRAIRKTYDQLVEGSRRYETLWNLVRDLTSLNEDLSTAQDALPGDLALDTEALEARLASFERLRGIVESVKSELQGLRDVQIYIEALGVEEAQLEKAYHDALVSAGECPVCGQDTKELAIV